MISPALVSATTACFGVAVISSGLYRFFMEPGGAAGLWFGLVMGGLALLAALLQRTRLAVAGDSLAALAALFVGGWFCYENFGKSKHELRMYLMILASAIELAVLAALWFCRVRNTRGNPDGK